MYTLLYFKWITNKDLLYGTGHSAQCFVAAWRVRKSIPRQIDKKFRVPKEEKWVWCSQSGDWGSGILKEEKRTNFFFFFPLQSLLLLLLLSCLSRVRLCVTPQTAAHQAPPTLGFSRQEHWSGLPFPSPMHESEK